MLQPSTNTNAAHENTLQCIDAENIIEKSMLHAMNALEYVNDLFTSAVRGEKYDRKYDELVEIMTTALKRDVHPDHCDIPKEFSIDYSGYNIKFRENFHEGKGKYSAEIICEKPVNSTRELKFEYDEKKFKGIATLLLLRQWDSGIIRHGSALLRHGFRINLDDANLKEANLKNANLEQAILDNVNLQEANLQGANLYESHMSNVNLQEANLQGAKFSYSVFEKTNLQGAKLQGADFSDANLQGANLQGAKLQGADFSDANLQGANLQGANLQEAKLQEAKLQGAKLQGANLDGINMDGVDLYGVDQDGVDFSGILNSPARPLSDWDKDELETYLRHRNTEDYKTEAAILKQKCDIWRGEAVPRHGELRGVAVERINQCLNNPTKNPNLNLTDLGLKSLPPLPYCNKLYVSEKLLEELLSLAVGNNSSDKIRGYFSENFIHHHFEKLFDEASNYNYDCIRDDIVEAYEHENTMGFYEEVREDFNSSKRSIEDEALEYFAGNLEQFSEHQGFSVDKLKSKLEDFLYDKFYEMACILGGKYQD